MLGSIHELNINKNKYSNPVIIEYLSKIAQLQKIE